MDLYSKHISSILLRCILFCIPWDSVTFAMPPNEPVYADDFNLSASDGHVREGLFFYSFETDKDKRTGLDLTPDKSLHLPKGFTLVFDVKFRVEVQNFGNIFRILGDDGLNVDLVSDYYAVNSNNTFSLMGPKGVLATSTISDLGAEAFDNWIRVKITIHPQSKKLLLSLNDVTREIEFETHASAYEIFFGSNTVRRPNITDVPPITVKNIRIYNDEQKLIRFWKLTKHSNNTVYDECGHHKAVVTYPCWMIDDHTKWKKECVFNLPGLFYQYTFDQKGERVFMVNAKEILVYSIHSKQLETIIPVHGIPFNLESNQLLYDPISNELISYEFVRNYLDRFNFDSRTWSNTNEEKTYLTFGHHGKYYMPKEKKIVAFAGYGLHQYTSTLQIYSEDEAAWSSFNLADSIPPRYLGSMGQLDDQSFLYFGGFGNFSGRQEELPSNFYDLYKVDIRNHSVQKIWDLQTAEVPFASASTMIIDKGRNVFYTLSFLNFRSSSMAFLHEYSSTTPQYHLVGDSIPYLFYDVQSHADLFLSSDKKSLYALTSEVRDSITTTTVYSIAYPPMNSLTVLQESPKKLSWFWFLFLLVIPPIFIVWNKKKKHSQIILPEESTLSDQVPISEIPVQQIPSSIYLLGEFTIINDEGSNIGATFTPTTRQIFLLLLLYTLKDGQGISSNELKKEVWEDKDDASARNVRNVYMNKIRNMLKDMKGLEIVKVDGYWKITLQPQVYCDYARVILLIYSLKKNGFNKTVLNELLDIVSRGKLLCYIGAEWLDDIKSNYSNNLIELLIETSKADELKNDYNLLLKLANAILLYDDTEEYGVKLKCYILRQLKRNREIRLCYQKYVDDYVKLYSEKPDLSIDEISKFKP